MRTETIMQHMGMIGQRVVDKVTGFAGVVTAMSFDLYGCIQAIVTPAVNKDTAKRAAGEWFDVQRLTVTDTTPVMEVPDFERGYIAEGKKGAAPKPPGRL